jgi:hypothetical protein
MQLIKAAAGHDNTAGYAELVCYQPYDIEYAEFLDAIDESVIPQGNRFATIRIGAATYSEYTAVLTAFGLSHTVFSANCTVYLQGNDGVFDDFNGVAKHRTGKQRTDSGGAWQDIEITVTELDEV